MLNRLRDTHNKEIQEMGYFCLINNSCSQKIIKRNIQKVISNWLAIAEDISIIEVGKTIDTNDFVLTFTDSKGNKASLWLVDNKLRSITPY